MRLALLLISFLALGCAQQPTSGAPQAFELAEQSYRQDLPICIENTQYQLDALVCLAKLRQEKFIQYGVEFDISRIVGSIDAMRINLVREGRSLEEADLLAAQHGRELLQATIDSQALRASAEAAQRAAASAALIRLGQSMMQPPIAPAPAITTSNCRWIGNTWNCSTF